jgi:hypothetical protein
MVFSSDGNFFRAGENGVAGVSAVSCSSEESESLFLYLSSTSSTSNSEEFLSALLDSNSRGFGRWSFDDSSVFSTRSIFADLFKPLAAFLFFEMVAIFEHFQG